MNNVIIHIGYPKVVSTWLKMNFFPLAKQYKLVEENDVIDRIIKPNAFTFAPNQERDFFLKKYVDNIIISESMLSGSLVMTGNNSVYTKEISHRLKSIFPDAQILIFIRNQPYVITSSYLEYIKKGGSYRINSYLWRTINIPLEFRLEFFEYDLIIEQYYKLFGEKNVHVFCYERFINNPKGFATSLNDQFKMNITLHDLDYSVRNDALQRNLYPIVRFINQFTRKGIFLKRYIIDLPCPRYFSMKMIDKLNDLKIFGGKANPKKVLGSDNLYAIIQYYRKSNQNLEGILKSVKLKELGYPL